MLADICEFCELQGGWNEEDCRRAFALCPTWGTHKHLWDGDLKRSQERLAQTLEAEAMTFDDLLGYVETGFLGKLLDPQPFEEFTGLLSTDIKYQHFCTHASSPENMERVKTLIRGLALKSLKDVRLDAREEVFFLALWKAFMKSATVQEYQEVYTLPLCLFQFSCENVRETWSLYYGWNKNPGLPPGFEVEAQRSQLFILKKNGVDTLPHYLWMEDAVRVAWGEYLSESLS